jgi:nicotinate phosphoribosyltransferase
MAQARFLLDEPQPTTCFELTFRSLPFEGGFAVCAGLGLALDFLQGWGFSADDIDYLRTLKAGNGSELFVEEFLSYLADLTFCANVDAVAEGTIVFAGEPLLRVVGPVDLCQMVETPLLNIINFSTLIATKAARCTIAAQGDMVLEFGLRRAQGPDGGLMATRASYIGGVAATSNTLAGQRYGIPVAGTHAHSWIMSFPDEIEAFRAYVKTSANNAVLLVDTYDTLQGVRNAITVGLEMQSRGQRLAGIRIDSGDLAWLSQQARRMLDEAGMPYVRIIASNALDEYTVMSLKAQGAAVDSWGIGTQMVTGGSQSALDGVYKMSAIRYEDGVWQPRMKLSEQTAKATIPGIHGVRRYYDSAGMMAGDMVYEVGAEGAIMVDPADSTRTKQFSADMHSEELLLPVMREGCCESAQPLLAQIRAKTLTGLQQLGDSHKRFLRPHSYPVGIEKSLCEQRRALIRTLRGGTNDE